MATNMTNVPAALDEDLKVRQYISKLAELRSTGVTRVSDLKQQITATKKSKMLSSETKTKLIEDCKKQIAVANADAASHKGEIDALTKEAVAYVNTLSAEIEKRVYAEEDAKIAAYKEEFNSKVAQIKANTEKRISAVTISDAKARKDEIGQIRYEEKSAIFDARSHYTTNVDRAKAAKSQAYVDHVQTNRTLRNGKTNFKEDMTLKWREYINRFKMSTFFLNNGLYIAVIIFFIVCVVIAPLQGRGALFSLPNILTILEQCSTRMFYALGVAGLILLAGTDLSVGRMVALGSVTTGLLLHRGTNIVTLFGAAPWNFDGIPMGLRVVIALLLSVILCVAFACFSGVFTAKLKIHPFISTMSTQLIIYGLLFFGTSGTPVGSIDSSIKDLLGGRWTLGVLNGQIITFPKLIIPAAVACVVAWFIWNKTIFGKNMYAVGGNSEAAAVSGISVFKVTMGVFIMAGIFYGCGAFLEAFRANASAGTGQGYETDAIAACVVGGISFNGGIGKIGGAIIGVIIFTGLTYCLTFLGIDTNLQFVFKGAIIIAAVALDSIKYLKKK